MSTLKIMAKNTGLLLIAQIVSQLLGLFFILKAARYLGAEGFGVLSFALALTGILVIFADIGLQPVTIREVARAKRLAIKYQANVTGIKSILSIATFALTAIYVNLLGYPEQTIEVVYLIALSVILTSFYGIFDSIFQAFEKMEYTSLGLIINGILLLAGAFFAMSEGYDVIGFSYIYLFVSMIVLGYFLAAYTWKFGLPKVEIDLSFCKPTMMEAIPFGLTSFFVYIYYYISSVILLSKGDEVVGYYNAPFKFVFALLFIITQPINFSVYPIMSKFYLTSKDSLRLVFETYYKYMAIIGIPMGICITILSDRIILEIYGSEYLPSVIPLQILIWSAVVLFLGSPFTRLLETTNNQGIITKITALNAVVNVLLNFALIPSLGAIGASIAFTATQFSAYILSLIACSKRGYQTPGKLYITFSKAIIAGLIMGAFIILLNTLNLLLLIFVSSVIYLIALYLLHGVDKEDIATFKKALQR